MLVFTYSEARQNLAEILTKSNDEEIVITRKDGSRYKIVPVETPEKSPLDIEGIKTAATMEDILAALQEIRARP